MNTISFDSHLNCTINVPADSAKISFLTNPLFSNTVEDLMTDIRNCHDNYLKSKLERFLQDIQLEKERLTEEIDNSNRLIEILKEYV